MNVLTRLLGVVAAIGATAGIVFLSERPWHAAAADDGLVRIAWSARPERIEHCRVASAEEQAQRPAHMRQQSICEGTSARYRLQVRRDGALLADDTVRGGGARHDRAVYVMREFVVPPGTFNLDVRFSRIDSAATPSATTPGQQTTADSVSGMLPDRGIREADERQRRRQEAIPSTLSASWPVTVAPRRVILVTYDPDLRVLVKRGTDAPK